MSALAVGVPAALAAAVCYNLAPVLQATGARREEPGHGLGLGLLRQLARRPRWLVGMALEIAGFVLEAVALAFAPLVLIQPLMAVGLVVLLIAGVLLLGERPGAAGLGAVAVLVAGAVLVVLAFAGRSGPQHPAGTADLLVTLGIAGAAVVALVAPAGRLPAATSAAVLAVGSGAAYGAASVFTRQVAVDLRAGDVVDLFAGPAPYALAASSAVAIGVFQRAVQQGRAVLAYPVVEATSTVVAVLIGAVILDEPVPRGADLALFVGGLVAVVAGVVLAAGRRAAHD